MVFMPPSSGVHERAICCLKDINCRAAADGPRPGLDGGHVGDSFSGRQDQPMANWTQRLPGIARADHRPECRMRIDELTMRIE
jgi:hypothetical protein